MLRRAHRAVLLLIVLIPLLAPSPASAETLSINGGFDAGLAGWTSSTGVTVVASDAPDGLTVERPGQEPFAKLVSGSRLVQGIDLSGRTLVTLSFDYLFASWDVGVPGGSSAPMLSSSRGRELTVGFNVPGGTPYSEFGTVSYDEPWDGTCWLPDPSLPLPRCSDGTPGVYGWHRFEQTWTAPAGFFDVGTELVVSELGWPPGFVDEHFAFYIDNVSVTAPSVPEPATLLMVALATACLVARSRRRA